MVLVRWAKYYGRIKDLLWFRDQLFALTDTGIWHFETKILMRGCGSGKIVENLFALQDGGWCLYRMSANGYFPIMKVLAGNEILNNAHIVLLAD